jgi:hypothetical protein
MTTSNDTRAERAQNALRAYIEAKGEVFENSTSEPTHWPLPTSSSCPFAPHGAFHRGS